MNCLLERLGFGETRCANCGMPFFTSANTGELAASVHLCPECQKRLQPYRGPACKLCGLPDVADLEAGATGRAEPGLCAACSQTPPPWDRIAFHGLYDGELRDLILRLKFDGELHIAKLLAEFLREASICLPVPDALVAIPQHFVHLRKRGYNQAQELAARLAALTGLPARKDLLARVAPGLVQESLNARERRENLKSAFRASQHVCGMAIWLIDDVLTTGSTCHAATAALKAAGAKTVHLLFVGRTPLA